MGSYAVVGQPRASKPREYGGPLGNNADQYVTYNGSGASRGFLLARLLYGWKFKEPNFLISGVFNADSKVLYNRDPRERVEKVAPS